MTLQIFSSYTASISDLKKHPMATVEAAHGEPVAILNRNQPVFYCVPASIFEAMMEALDDVEIKGILEARQAEREIEVSLDEL